MEKLWYVVHTYSGYENRVKQNLEKRVETMGMSDYIFRIIVAEEDYETETKTGIKKQLKKKIFPGYVLVEMIMTDESWYVVRNTPNVTGFVGSAGSGSKPNPLLPEEATKILSMMGYSIPVEHDFVVGDVVTVLDGPFADYTAKVQSVDAVKGKLTLFIDILGREVPAELDFASVVKI
ncbi:MAG: transcription termination/antitermination protein NusG [Bacillales bacterium]|jgi:transcriptional antiterminator NusG|nr:transcription termination/antitermination protein NusG [Bacillales bacterium]